MFFKIARETKSKSSIISASRSVRFGCLVTVSSLARTAVRSLLVSKLDPKKKFYLIAAVYR